MLSIEEAKKLILENIPERKIREIPLTKALGYAVAQDVISPINIPSFANSAMDGYAFCVPSNAEVSEHTPMKLEVQTIIKAGTNWNGVLQTRECAKIMTGAPLPKGADTVIMQEKVEYDNGSILIKRPVPKGDNVRFLGEDVKEGELLLKEGSRIRAQEIALLAACGYKDVWVYQSPSIGVLSTGSELTQLGEPLSHGEIYDSNSYSLVAQLQSIGIYADRIGICKDDENALRMKIQEGLNKDLLIISGGVSVGEYDLVKKILSDLSVEEIFWKVAIKPGKPLFMGKKGNTRIFGVPGNPVSGFVCFEVFIRPFLLAWTRRLYLERIQLEAVLKVPITKKKGRIYFIRAITTWKDGHYVTRPSGPQGSHQMKALSRSNSFLIMNPEVDRLNKGETIKITMVDE